MKYLLFCLFFILFSSGIFGKTIEFDENRLKNDRDYYILIGLHHQGQYAKFVVFSDALDKESSWDGEGSPSISQSEAISLAKNYYSGEGKLVLSSLSLLKGWHHSMKDFIWFYAISLVPINESANPEPSDKELSVVILTSGDIVPPFLDEKNLARQP
jgi:hypothetical protein